MGQADMNGQALLPDPGSGCAGQGKIGRTALLAQYGQLGHGKAAQTGAGGLQEGFLGRKICGGGLGAALFA